MKNKEDKFNSKIYTRYDEGSELYSMSVRQFTKISQEAGAVRKIGGTVLINMKILNEYIEMHAVPAE